MRMSVQVPRFMMVAISDPGLKIFTRIFRSLQVHQPCPRKRSHRAANYTTETAGPSWVSGPRILINEGRPPQATARR